MRRLTALTLTALTSATLLLSDSAGQSVGTGEARLELQATLRAHDARVNAVQFSADSHLLATGGSDSQVNLWNAETGQRLGRMDHQASVSALEFSADGLTLYSGGGESVRAWSLPERQPLRTWREASGLVTSLSLSPDGAWLAVGNSNRSVGLYSVQNGARRELQAHTEAVRAVKFSRDGRHLLSGSADGTVQVWSVNGQVERTLRLSGPVSALDLSKNGKLLAAATLSGAAEVWDWAAGERLATLPGSSGLASVSFSLDDRYLRTGAFDRQVRLWDWRAGRVLQTEAQPATVTALAYSRDARRLAVARSSSDERQNLALYRSSDQPLNDPLPPPPAAGQRRLFVLSVGVEVFSNPEVGALNYTVDDVTELTLMFEKVQNTPLYSRVVSRLLVNGDATRERILQNMREIASAVTPQDTVYVFFASHGEEVGGEYYFLPYDVRTGQPQSAISGQEMTAFIGRIPGRVVVFLDTCHAGGVSGQAGPGSASPQPFMNRATKVLAGQGSGSAAQEKVFISAAGPGQLSNEAQGLTNGFFSYAVMEGLRGQARAGSGQNIGLQDLFGYVQRRVPELVSARPGAAPQNPVATPIPANWPVMP